MYKTPTTIFTGFLGSGKTTIISHLIDELQASDIQVAYIKNEIGETDIDSQIMEGKHIKTKELLNGCICCTLVGPFIDSINEVIDTTKPDRIIIEASGAADPAALALMVADHPRLLRDGVLSVIDVINFEGYQDLSITAQEQTKFTDILLFNKVELADDDQKQRVVHYVRELNTHSPIIEVHEGNVDPSLILGLDSKELETLLTNHDHSLHDHIKSDGFEAFTIIHEGIFNTQQLLDILNNLPPALFRAKGIVQTEGGWQVFNTVANRTTLTNLEITSKKPEVSTLVFIGYKADQYKDLIMNQMSGIKN